MINLRGLGLWNRIGVGQIDEDGLIANRKWGLISATLIEAETTMCHLTSTYSNTNRSGQRKVDIGAHWNDLDRQPHLNSNQLSVVGAEWQD
jgi:hypothetical protein